MEADGFDEDTQNFVILDECEILQIPLAICVLTLSS